MNGFLRAKVVWAMVIAGMLVMWGCASGGGSGGGSLEAKAPVVDEKLVKVAGGQEGVVEKLQQGRKIYLTRCTACHVPEAIGGYGRKQWEGILHRMSDRTGLDAAAQDAVSSYVFAVLAMQGKEKEVAGVR